MLLCIVLATIAIFALWSKMLATYLDGKLLEPYFLTYPS